MSPTSSSATVDRAAPEPGGLHDADSVTLPQVLIFGTVTTSLLMAGLWSDKALAAAFGLAVVVCALPFASGISLVFFGLVLGVPVAMSEFALEVPGFKIYPADGIAFFFLAAALRVLWGVLTGRHATWARPRAERVVLLLTVGLALYGLLPGAIATLARHYPLNDVLGTYRRLHYYPLALVIPLILRWKGARLSILNEIIVASTAAVLLTALYRMATGHSYEEDYFTLLAYRRRWMGTPEVVTLEMALAYSVVAMRLSRHTLAFALHAAIAGASGAMLFLSGWRLGILVAVAAPVLAYLLVARARHENLWSLVKALSVLAVIGVVSAIVLYSMSDYAAEQVRNLQERLLEGGEDGRYYVWSAALARFAEHPMFGIGLGHQLFHYFRTSGGEWLGRIMTTHNYPLDVLYQTGIVGFGLFAALHGAFNLHFLRRLTHIPAKHLAVAVGLYVGYLCNLLTHSLEPTLTAGMVAMYMSMGFVLVLLRPSDRQEQGLIESFGVQEQTTG